MTEVDPDKPWYKKPFKLIPLTSPVVDVIRPFTKGFFDILKNLIAATAVIYFGQKTGNIELKILGYFASILISVHIMSYVQMWRISFFFARKSKFWSLIDGLLYIAIMNVILFGGFRYISKIIADITQAQAK